MDRGVGFKVAELVQTVTKPGSFAVGASSQDKINCDSAESSQQTWDNSCSIPGNSQVLESAEE